MSDWLSIALAPAPLLTALFPGFVPFKGGVYQVRIEARVGLAQLVHYLRQIQHSPRGRLFKQPNRSNNREPAMNGRTPPGTIIHQNGGGFDLARQANRFQFPGVYIQRKVECLGGLYGGPHWQRTRPLSHGCRSIRLLKF